MLADAGANSQESDMPMTDDQRTWLNNLFSGDASTVVTATGPGVPSARAPVGSGGFALSESLAAGDDDVSGPVGAANIGTGGPRNGPPADELDPGEGKNRDGSFRRKAGEGGRARGRDSKREQDRDVTEAARDFGLTDDEQEKLHDEVTARNLDRDGIRGEAKAIRDGRKPAKPDPEDAEDEDRAPEPDDGISTADKVIAGALAVAATAAVVGIVAAPIPVADVPIEIGVVAVVAVAGLVIGGASLFKALTEDGESPPEA